jgi:hypothetical protein
MPSHFSDDADLVAFATKFVNERVLSLQADVSHCICTKPYAPFLAILYDFSRIDLLGALVAGRADGRPTRRPMQRPTSSGSWATPTSRSESFRGHFATS